MPSPSAVQDSERGAEVPSTNSASSLNASVAVNLLHGPDPSIHMLGLPKSHPQLGRWVAMAILAGAIAAAFLVALMGG